MIGMKMIEAVIRPFKLDEVRSALAESGVTAMTVSEVLGAGPRSARNDIYRGLEYTRLVPGLKLEVAVPDRLCDQMVRIITRAARTGQRGAGMIFVSTLDGATKVGSGECGEAVL
jgi:nitrogen regulatory protein P-II 1